MNSPHQFVHIHLAKERIQQYLIAAKKLRRANLSDAETKDLLFLELNIELAHKAIENGYLDELLKAFERVVKLGISLRLPEYERKRQSNRAKASRKGGPLKLVLNAIIKEIGSKNPSDIFKYWQSYKNKVDLSEATDGTAWDTFQLWCRPIGGGQFDSLKGHQRNRWDFQYFINKIGPIKHTAIEVAISRISKSG